MSNTSVFSDSPPIKICRYTSFRQAKRINHVWNRQHLCCFMENEPSHYLDYTFGVIGVSPLFKHNTDIDPGLCPCLFLAVSNVIEHQPLLPQKYTSKWQLVALTLLFSQLGS